MKKIIEVNNLVKHYGPIKAVDDISFEVYEGELFAFLGLNGAGKTTTINIISGLLKADKGTVLIDGVDIAKEALLAKQKIGIVFQHSTLDNTLSVYDNLLTKAALYGLNKATFQKRVDELAELLTFKDILKRPYGSLSGGQKRKIDVARGLINYPKLLILDEPTTGLDPQTRKNLWDVLEGLKETYKMTILLTTHYLEEANKANRVLIIDNGKLLASGTPNSLKESYSGTYLYIYSEQNNKLEEAIKGLDWTFSYIKDRYEIKVPKPLDAYLFIKNNEALCKDFELIKGDMDKAFLNITGKKLSGDV